MSWQIIYTESYLKRAARFVKKHPELISQYEKKFFSGKYQLWITN